MPEVFQNGQLLIEAGRLEHHADAPPVDRAAFHRRAPLGRLHQGAEDAEQRGLAAAIRTKQTEDLAAPDRETHGAQRDASPVRVSQRFDGNDGCAGGHVNW